MRANRLQGMGSILIDRIEGTFDNVVGLPLRATLQLIEKIMLPDDDEELDELGTGFER
jgi:septum formation protein